MRNHRGFTLIEVLLLIIVTAILANTIYLALNTAARKTPQFLYNMMASQSARLCIEYYLGQRRLQWGDGYTTISCPSTTVPTDCSAALPSGFSMAVDITCTTINSDANYKTITVTVSGNGAATYSTLIADY